jgi:hypothetical protein
MKRELIGQESRLSRKHLIHKVFHTSATRHFTLFVQLSDEADMESLLHRRALVGGNAAFNP